MDRDRGRDRRGEGEVTRMGGGESYRPAARSPPRDDLFRDRGRARSPRRERARTPPQSIDSWHPGMRDRSPRRRSRTPPRRDRSPIRDSWRARPRSPPRARTPPRRYSPRRDDDRRARSPPRRDDRRRSRSPFDRDRERDRPAPRARSPLRRSPPPSERRSYRPRSRSPDPRDYRSQNGPSSSNWRRRSPSPQARDSERSSGRDSGNTSRRSSPPIHQERMQLAQPSNRDSRPKSPVRDHSPPVQLTYRERESAKSTPRERSPVRAPAAPRSPPRGPAGFRAPPTGPSSARNFTAPVQPSRPIGISAHSRPENSGPVVPPSGPRGYVPPVRGAPYGMRGGRGSFGSDRIIRPDSNTWKAAPAPRPTAEISTRGSTPTSRPAQAPSPSIPSAPSIPTGPSAGIPTGPRAGIPSRPNIIHSSNIYNRNNSMSSTSLNNLNNNYNNEPRPHPAMANMPSIIPGGRIDPTATGMTIDITNKLARKQEEEEVLRKELHVKQEKLRVGLKDWEKLRRESSGMGLKSELSERHVRMLAGEGMGGAAF